MSGEIIRRNNHSLSMLEKFKNIRAIVLDVDGVLTDGMLILFHHGHMLRRMNIKDGFALQLAVKKGYKLIVVSGSHSEASIDRLERLGITDVRMEVKNKGLELQSIMDKYELQKEEVLFMGDDIPDLPALKLAGLPCCPADAVPEVKALSQYISPVAGGMGCVRDVIEKVLRLNGHWDFDEQIASI
jgi:3-deoxy-D-manno-octulosonate 8-phosphate phosphatase (KDO 8-P phosphatase)